MRDRQVEVAEGGLEAAGIGDCHAGEAEVGSGRDDVDPGSGHRRRRQRLVEDREGAGGDRPAGRARVIARGQVPQRQEELGDDDQDREGAVEGDDARHQPQADLDGDQRDRHCRAPFEDERRLECGPQDLHRRLAVLAADRPDVADLLAAPPEHLERREAGQHVEEEGTQPADLGEPTLGDRLRPAADEPEQEDEDRPGHEQDQGRRWVDHQDGGQDEQRDRDRQRAGRLERRQVGVDGVHPVGDDPCQFAGPFAAGPHGTQGQQMGRQRLAHPTAGHGRGALRQRVARERQRRPDQRQQRDRDEARRDRGEGSAALEDVSDDDAHEPCLDHHDDRGGEPAGDRGRQPEPRAGRGCEQTRLRGRGASARHRHPRVGA